MVSEVPRPMASFKGPDPFVPGSTPAASWAEYKTRFRIYASATKLAAEPVEQQRNIFLHVLGIEGLRLYQTLPFANPVEATRTLQDIYDAFDAYFLPYKNVTFLQYQFFQTKQGKHQSFAQFLTSLKSQAADCEFGPLENDLVRTQIVAGTNNDALRKRMLAVTTLDLPTAVSMAQSDETSAKHALVMDPPPATFAATPSAAVDTLSRPRQSQRSPGSRGRSVPPPPRQHWMSRQQPPRSAQRTSTKPRPCSQCAGLHSGRPCPALGSTCHKCSGRDHWANACRSTYAIEAQPLQPHLTPGYYDRPVYHRELAEYHAHPVTQGYYASDPSLVDDFADMYLNVLTINSARSSTSSTLQHTSRWMETLYLGNHAVQFKIDTGSEVNVISRAVYDAIPAAPPLQQPINSIKAFSGHPVDIIGMVHLQCGSATTTITCLFYVTPGTHTPIIGATASESLGLVRRLTPKTSPYTVASLATPPATIARSAEQHPADIIANFRDVFDTIGCLPGKHSITLRAHAEPCIASPRKIPQALREGVRHELKRMETLGVIVPVHEPTDWVHPMVVVRKPNGGLRICLDPRKLNDAIKREHHPLPTTQDIFSQLHSSKVFTVLDAQSAFWQIELTDESSLLCTFATPFGRFRFTRLPYGICSATEIFQRTMHTLYADFDNTHISTDDFLLHATTIMQHNVLLTKVLQRARDSGLRFSSQKMQLAQSTIKYLGHLITQDGIRVDPAKVTAVASLQPPVDKKALQRFLGIINYLAKFIPMHSLRTSLLRSLLKPATPFLWDSHHQDCFTTLKQAIIRAPVLSFFDPSAHSVISVDASQHGMGATLMQNGHPIEYASATFNETQKRYAQIEKEYLAILFACDRFHFYIACAPFTIHTDHKPLLSIIKKPMHLLSPRLQRLTLQILRYQPTLEYVPGKLLYIADALSRAPSDSTFDTPYLEGPTATVYALTVLSDDKRTQFRNATAADSTMQQLLQYIRSGWPSLLKQVPPSIQPYWAQQEEFHEADGMVFRGDRLVVPPVLQKDVLQQLHGVHQGITACLNKAKLNVYWPQITTDITNYVKDCSVCLNRMRANSAPPLTPHPAALLPWQTVGTDLFKFRSQDIILLVDYHSKFVEAQTLHATNAEAVINFMLPHFARHGPPQVVISDNGPPFNSAAFKDFLQKWGVRHTTSSPYYPQSNGLAERTVQTLKHLLAKAHAEGKDLNYVLLEYRSTPFQDMASPAELLMGRRLRTPLTASNNTLQPHFPIHRTQLALQDRRHKMIAHDSLSNPRELAPLHPGEAVRYFAGPRNWQPATILACGPEPNSYTFRTSHGNIFRRNRIHLRPLPRSPPALQHATPPLVSPRTSPPRVPVPQSQAFYSTSSRPCPARLPDPRCAIQHPPVLPLPPPVVPPTSLAAPRPPLAPLPLMSSYGRVIRPNRKYHQ